MSDHATRSSERTTPEGHGLLLGWRTGAAGRAFGFLPSAPHRLAGEGPELYTGDGHLNTFAPTGSGKGRGVIIPNLLRCRAPVIVVDPKGENYQVTARRRARMGHRVVALDPFRVVTEHGDRFNPLDVLRLERAAPDPDADAEMFASLLAVGHEFSTDRYWNDCATGLTAGLLAHLMSDAWGGERTLNALRELLYDVDLDYTVSQLLESEAVRSRVARHELSAYLAIPAEKTRPCVHSTATTYVKVLGSAAVSEALGPSSFDLQDVVDGKPLSIFLIIPPEKLESHSGLLRLWVAALLCAVTSRRHIPENRTLFILDECAQLGPFPLLRQAVTLLRGYGLQVWSFWQDLSQVRELYPRDWQAMVSNSEVLQVFGLRNNQVAREWCDFFGREAAELLEVGPEEAILFTPGEGYRRCRRPDYLRDRAFAGQFDANERFRLHAPGGPTREAS
jgi:type IV secretion system protein VirD4